jgi:hypothetical protein
MHVNATNFYAQFMTLGKKHRLNEPIGKTPFTKHSNYLFIIVFH